MPSSPGHVRPVREVAGERIYQAYMGSSANPGYRDFAVSATMVRGRRVNDRVSFDVSPTSRAQLETLVRDGHIASLIHAGARLHQAGCNGCIGMGQAPATHALSLRTVPRNFPGRSGTREDKVCLVSPETATASALTGVITDPRSLGIDYPRIADPNDPIVNRGMFVPPLPREEALQVAIEKGPNIASLPTFAPLSDVIEGPVLLKVGDDVSTDEIMPAGTRVLPFRSNIPRIAEFSFDIIDPTYAARAKQTTVTRGGRREQLRARVKPRARRAGPAVPRASRRRGQELRAHPRSEPDQLRCAAADLCRPCRLHRRSRPGTCCASLAFDARLQRSRNCWLRTSRASEASRSLIPCRLGR